MPACPGIDIGKTVRTAAGRWGDGKHMKKLILVLSVIIVVCAVLAAVFGLKRVPEGHEALRVGSDGKSKLYSAGTHVVLPGYDDFVLYRVGELVCRVPVSGTVPVRDRSGEEVGVAFEFTFRFPDGGASQFYRNFGRDFDGAAERVIREAAEIEAAGILASGDRGGFKAAVAKRVEESLAPAGVAVTGYTLLAWGDFAVTGEGALEKPLRKLVIVGVDGGDWMNLKPLVVKGRLPNFKRLLEEGATGPLRTIEPMLSPLLWTTIATGKYPEDHGVLNFTIADPETGKKVPITRYYRKADAFWNIVGDYGRKVCVAGWLATHPAEKINGTMVTDKVGYLAYTSPDEDERRDGDVYPENRLDEISALVERGRDVDYEEISPFLHIGREEFENNRSLEFDPKNSINTFILLYASTKTYLNIGLHLLEQDAPDVLAVYFEWVDAASHLFMLHSAPRLPDVDETDYQKYKDAVEQSYVYQDRLLGRFMDAVDDETVLMVISDHGFKSGASRLKNRPEIWAGNAAKWHRLDGIIGLYGNGIKKGYEITQASILDVAPTILALQGLPAAADMPGKALVEALEDDLAGRVSSNVVATLQRDRGEEKPASLAAGTASAETMKKLEALGYLTPDNADAHNNLGQRYQQRGEYLKAIEEYEKALALNPVFHPVYNNMAVCFGKLKRFDDAERALLKAIEIKPNDFYAMNNLAVTYMSTGRLEDALKMAERIVAVEPGYANGHITLGSVCAMTGRYDRAEKAFETALTLEPGNEKAAENLRRLRQQKRGSGSE